MHCKFAKVTTIYVQLKTLLNRMYTIVYLINMLIKIFIVKESYSYMQRKMNIYIEILSYFINIQNTSS